MNWKKYILGFILMGTISNLRAENLPDGHSGGNGGEKVGLHFTESSRTALRWIQEHNDASWVLELNQQLNPLTLSEAILDSVMTTKIEVVSEKLILNGKEKIAINYPDQKLIKVNIKLWEASTKADQIAIAAHEHFGIIGIDDSNYFYSTQILRNFTNEKVLSDLVVIAGMPNIKVGDIEEILDQNIILNPELPDRSLTTRIYSILKNQRVQSVANIQVLSKLGSTTLSMLSEAINKSAKIAPIVLIPLGPTNNIICKVLAHHRKTVFILPSGSDGSVLNPPKDCLNDNIVFVSHLNDEMTDLASSSNRGDFVTIAAPGTNTLVLDEEGVLRKWSGGTLASSFIASALVQYLENNPTLRGSHLVNSFLKEETNVLSTLIGKTKNGRAWVKK